MKEFLSYLKPYKRDAVLAVFCIEAETVFELIIPLVMASIVDVGVATGDRHYILMKGLQMVLFALISLVLGQGSAMFSARCGQGLGAEIRKAEFAKLQQFSFANTDHFSSSSHHTKLCCHRHAARFPLTGHDAHRHGRFLLHQSAAGTGVSGGCPCSGCAAVFHHQPCAPPVQCDAGRHRHGKPHHSGKPDRHPCGEILCPGRL